MNLEDFPMDIQKCPLKFGSCKYNLCKNLCRRNMLYGSLHLQKGNKTKSIYKYL